MCSDLPSSQSADIYKRLLAESISRTKSRNFEPVIIRNNFPTKNRKTDSNIPNFVKQYEFKRSPVNEKTEIQKDRCKRINQVSVVDNSSDAQIGLQIKINSYNQNSQNEPPRSGNRSTKEEPRNPSRSNKKVDEAYDDDMMSVWSSFDLKTYCLSGKLRDGACMRANSAPPQRQQYRCRNAAIFFSEEVKCQRNRTSISPRKNKKLQHVLTETTPKLIKDIPIDYEIFLKALKLEKCVPSGVSDNQIRQNINRVINRHDSATRK